MIVIAGIIALVLGTIIGLVAAMFNCYARGVVEGRRLLFCPSCRCQFCRLAKKRDNSEPFTLN